MSSQTTIKDFGRQLVKDMRKDLPPSQLNTSQRKRIARLEALVKEAEVITASLVVNGYTRWFNKEMNAAILKFNRKASRIKKGGT